MKQSTKKTLFILALLSCAGLLVSCISTQKSPYSEKWIAKQAQKYVAGRNDIDDALRQSILAGKITVGMFPDEAVAAGGPFFYSIEADGGTMASMADIRFYFEYERIKPDSRGIPPDILWMQRENRMTNATITLTFWNKTQFDTDDFVNTRVRFDAGRASSIEKLEKTKED